MYYVRDATDKTLEDNVILKFAIESVWRHSVFANHSVTSHSSFREFLSRNELFFLFDALPRVDLPLLTQMAPRYAIPYSNNQEIPILSSTQAAWRRRTLETTPLMGYHAIIRFTVSTACAFFCRALEKSRDKKKLSDLDVSRVALQSTPRRESTEKRSFARRPSLR